MWNQDGKEDLDGPFAVVIEGDAKGRIFIEHLMSAIDELQQRRGFGQRCYLERKGVTILGIDEKVMP